ncbi:MAG: cephalosporin hydroxylase family protein [Pseudomonadota bacterium]
MIKIDSERSVVIVESDGTEVVYPMSSPEAFALASEAWLRCGWDVKHVYSFTWLGRPIIQLAEDLVRMQEVVYSIKPDVIVETGIAHGGSLVFYASLCRLIGRGRVIGIDIEIRPHNLVAIQAHELFPFITLVEGSSIAPATVDRVCRLVAPGEKVLVILDSNHTKDHVLAELEAYASLVSVGSYIIAADGIKELVAGGPRTAPDWSWNHPKAAAEAFVALNPDFAIVEPPFAFNEGQVDRWVTYWRGGFVRRIR